MNRYKKELFKNFTAEEIEQMEEFDSKVRELHTKIFPEEYDYMWDSYADAQDRNKGVNPMNKSYIEKIKDKRTSLGIPQLSESGMPVDNTTNEICKNEILARAENRKTEWTERIDKMVLSASLN